MVEVAQVQGYKRLTVDGARRVLNDLGYKASTNDYISNDVNGNKCACAVGMYALDHLGRKEIEGIVGSEDSDLLSPDGSRVYEFIDVPRDYLVALELAFMDWWGNEDSYGLRVGANVDESSPDFNAGLEDGALLRAAYLVGSIPTDRKEDY